MFFASPDINLLLAVQPVSVFILYSLDSHECYISQNEIFKDFEDFKNSFWLKFEELN